MYVSSSNVTELSHRRSPISLLFSLFVPPGFAPSTLPVSLIYNSPLTAAPSLCTSSLPRHYHCIIPHQTTESRSTRSLCQSVMMINHGCGPDLSLRCGIPSAKLLQETLSHSGLSAQNFGSPSSSLSLRVTTLQENFQSLWSKTEPSFKTKRL